MAVEIDDDKLIQAHQYWHDCGFDEGYELGYEEGYEAGREEVCGGTVEKAEGLGAVQRNRVDQ